MTRNKAPSEDELHRKMHMSDTVQGALKGLVAHKALNILSHSRGSAAPGALLGGIAGAYKGKERGLKDKAQQERMDMRRAKSAGFEDAMAKLASISALTAAIGGAGYLAGR